MPTLSDKYEQLVTITLSDGEDFPMPGRNARRKSEAESSILKSWLLLPSVAKEGCVILHKVRMLSVSEILMISGLNGSFRILRSALTRCRCAGLGPNDARSFGIPDLLLEDIALGIVEA